MTRFRTILLVMAAVLGAPAAFAQDAGASGGGLMGTLIMIIPMILIFYFLLIRPQNKRRKAYEAMIAAIKKGDTVVTSGGLIGKVIKATDDELTLEVADNVRVRARRSMVFDVPSQRPPVPANDTKG